MTDTTLLFTDLVDSTLLVERLGDARAAELWADHDRRARDLLAQWNGREIDRSDGFLLIFGQPAAAAAFALAYHLALAELALLARVGMHVGPVTLRDTPAADIARGAKQVEVEGLAKPFAARIMALARGGQTLLSAAARSALGNAPDGAAIDSHGYYRLKGVEAPVEVFELGLQRHCAFTPPADTDKAYRVVIGGDLWRPLREVRHNLPGERDPFVGRTAELRELAQRLDAGARLVSVIGPGGTGKTRFVRRYGMAWLGDWPGGVYFCDLCEARSPEGIHFAVAAALGVPLTAGDATVQLGHAIAARGRCLVILDNFEQLVAHAAATVGQWLDRASNAAFVVTSRERLHLAGEALFAIEPLGLEHEAIQLFEVRAKAQRADFALGPANRAAVAEVVRLLDGLPLAIELAAARVRVMSPAQLVERLRDRFRLLAGARGAAARQATLKAAIDWSWELLVPWEQAALAQCSVFEGGFTLEAAEAVLELVAWPEAPPAMDAVQALVDKSLLRSWARNQPNRLDIDEPHFGMYLSIHEYAAEKLVLELPPAREPAQARHGRYFATFGTEAALEALYRHGGVRRRSSLAMELDNLVAACRRAVLRGASDIAVATCRAAWQVLDLQGPFGLGAELGAQVLAMDSISAPQRCALCVQHAVALRRIGRIEDAHESAQRALAIARESGDRHGESIALGGLGVLYTFLGRVEEGLACDLAALAIHRERGDRRLEGAALSGIAVQHHDQGRMDEARAHYEAALAIQRGTGNRLAEGIVLGNLGTLYNDQGRLEQARSIYLDTIAICKEVGDRHGEGVTLGNLGKLDMDQGRMDDALVDYEAALAIDREVGDRRGEGIVIGQLGNLHQAQGRLDDARTCYAQSLVIAREVGNRRFEGEALANLAELLVVQRRFDEAREMLLGGEALLREIGDRLDLASLLTVRGRADAGAGDSAAAHAALTEAQAIADVLDAQADSALRKQIGRLRDTLA